MHNEQEEERNKELARTAPTHADLAHEVERLRGLMEQQDRHIIRLTAELKMYRGPRGFVNAKKRRRAEDRAVKHAIGKVMR